MTVIYCYQVQKSIYFSEQLSFDMVKGMNDAVKHLNAGNDIFVYAQTFISN